MRFSFCLSAMVVIGVGLTAGAQAPGGAVGAPKAGVKVAKRAGGVKAAVVVPLDERERVLQLLDRFTFGPRPGEVERVEGVGAENWFAQQLTPDSIPDDAVNRRLGDYPTLGMSPATALMTFPDRKEVQDVAEGKMPPPQDPMLRAVYEVQVAKYEAQQEKKADGSAAAPVIRVAAGQSVAAGGPGSSGGGLAVGLAGGGGKGAMGGGQQGTGGPVNWKAGSGFKPGAGEPGAAGQGVRRCMRWRCGRRWCGRS